MKNLFKTVAFISLFAALPAVAEDHKLDEAAARLIKSLKFEESIITSGKASFKPMVERLVSQGLSKENIEELKTSFISYMTNLAADPELQKTAIESYQNTFTPEELEQMIAFNETPLGQKILKEQPKLMANMMSMSMKLAERYSKPFQKKMQEIMSRPKATDGE